MWLYTPAKNLSHSEGTWLCDYTFQPKIYPILRGPDYVIIISSQKSIPFWGDLTIWLYPKEWILSHSEGTRLCDYDFQPKIYPILRGIDHVIIISSQKSIPFWGELTVIVTMEWNLSHSEGTWLCDYTFQSKIHPILRGTAYVIILSSQKSIPFWGDLTIWLYPKEWILLHSEGTWLCDYTFQPKIYPILSGIDYVIIISSQKSIPFWGDLTIWLYPKEWILSHSEGTRLCDYDFQPKIYPILRGIDYVIIISSQKSIPFWGDLTVIVNYGMKSITFWGDLTMWLYFPVKNLSHSERNCLCDYTFEPKIYPILRRPDYVIINSSQKSIPYWGKLTMSFYFTAKNLSHSEGTWLCDCVLRNEIYNILKWPDYVIILSSLNSIPFWGDLTMWFLFQPKNYPILKKPVYVIMISSQKSIPIWGDLTRWLYTKEWNLVHSGGTWLCDYTLQPKIYPILRGPDYVIIHSSQKSIPFWGDLTTWL